MFNGIIWRFSALNLLESIMKFGKYWYTFSHGLRQCVTVTELAVMKIKLARQMSLKNAYIESRDNPTEGLAANKISQKDGRNWSPNRAFMFYFAKVAILGSHVDS